MKDFFTAFGKRLDVEFERELIRGTMYDKTVKERRAQISRFLWFSAQIGTVVGWKSHRKKDKLDRVFLKYFSLAACMHFFS